MMVAVTDAGRLLLIEQHRIPFQRPVIELPAGLVGDPGSPKDEPVLDAARRELLEETGYEARRIVELAGGPVSAGLSNERVTIVYAGGLRRRSAGGGTGSESIRVHEVPLAEVDQWLADRAGRGVLIDIKIYAGLYLLSRADKKESPP